MKCPLCSTELRIQSNNLVKRKDGTFAYKMVLTCQSQKCPNYLKEVSTVYTPVEITEEE